MTYNLIDEKWLPVRRLDNTIEYIAPYQITEKIDTNTIIDLATPRDDFDCTTLMQLIGLFQTAINPKKSKIKKFIKNPPSPEELKTLLEPIHDAFELMGERPRYYQDYGLEVDEKSETTNIEHLLMGSPGDITVNENRDFFVRGNLIEKLCPSCVAMALYAHENFNSIGKYHRKPMFGGSNAVTIINGNNLWETICLNLLPRKSFDTEKYGNPELKNKEAIFPWMTLYENKIGSTSKKIQVHTHEVAPAHVYWSMPRRLLVDFENIQKGKCDLCQCESDKLATKFYRKTLGINYAAGCWHHPLIPTNVKSSTNHTPLTIKSNLTYDNWLGLVQMKNNSKSNYLEPAEVIHDFAENKSTWDIGNEILKTSTRLKVFSYKLNKADVLSWYHSNMPLINIDQSLRQEYENNIEQMIESTRAMITNTKRAVLSLKGKDEKNNKNLNMGELKKLENLIWKNTEAVFYQKIDELKKLLENGEDTEKFKENWMRTIADECERIYNIQYPLRNSDLNKPDKIAKVYKYIKTNDPNTGYIRKIAGLKTLEKDKKNSKKKNNKKNNN